MQAGRTRGTNGYGRAKGFKNVLQLIWMLRHDRLSFSLCLAGLSLGGDTLDGGTATADDSKDGINVSLGLVTLARRAQALAISH